MLIGSNAIDSDSVGENGIPLPLPPRDADNASEPPLVLDSDKQAMRRLLSRAVPQDELPSVIETIISKPKSADIAGSLRGGDAQTFIDIIDEASYHTIPSLKNQSVDLF